MFLVSPVLSRTPFPLLPTVVKVDNFRGDNCRTSECARERVIASSLFHDQFCRLSREVMVLWWR